MSAFSIPLSGLAASSSSLNVIANNLANLNTDGFKSETLSFADVFNAAQGTSGNGDPIQIGSGVLTGATSSNFTNGGVSSTGESSNMALQGNGFFVVQGNGQTEYTRDGNFTTNNAGQLVTAGGQLVMGYPAINGVVSTSGALKPISVSSTGTIPGVASSSFSTDTNLNSSATVGTTYSTPITVYDSLGASHVLTVNYTNTAANAWSYSITMPAADTGGTGAATVLKTGNLTFNSSGQLTAPTGSVAGINITGLADGAANMSVSWNLNGSGTTPTITQLDSTSATTATTQNGYGVGTLTGYTVLSDGTVEGQFSNNQTLSLGQVAVASFSNNEGLQQVGGNNYQSTVASGTAVVGTAGSGGNGTITGGAVEESNVDLSTQFAEMIVAQQGYEANAKVLTTLDQVSQATIQLIS
jgi:flagellar hook protein FlgE